MKAKRDSQGKFKLKGVNYKSKIMRVTSDEYNMVIEKRLTTTEIAVVVLDNIKKGKCFGCNEDDSNKYINIHETCFDEFMKSKTKLNQNNYYEAKLIID